MSSPDRLYNPRETGRVNGLALQADETLARRVAGGDSRAFDLLVDRYAGRFFNLAIRYMGEESAAEDMVQEAFTSLWQKAALYDPARAPFKSWFFRLLINRCLSEKRRKIPEPTDAVIDDIPDETGPEKDYWLRERERQLLSLLNELEDRPRMAISLIYYQDLKYRDAAEMMDMNIKAFESLVTRARLKLGAILAARGWGAELLLEEEQEVKKYV